eukprot:TRINITY_DN1808_c0_g1_i2.p1 TRINITY_DN1808_c0_g1~~TRINITY_DN1808_c0_g1_i2.p1  ORF type:complete len:271 (-),score=-45.85 TRINITY_DN1808_c0_g1_i2:64-876(-)
MYRSSAMQVQFPLLLYLQYCYILYINSTITELPRFRIVSALFLYNARPISFAPSLPILLDPMKSSNNVYQGLAQSVSYFCVMQVLFPLLLCSQYYSLLQRQQQYQSKSIPRFITVSASFLQSASAISFAPTSPIQSYPIKITVFFKHKHTDAQRNAQTTCLQGFQEVDRTNWYIIQIQNFQPLRLPMTRLSISAPWLMKLITASISCLEEECKSIGNQSLLLLIVVTLVTKLEQLNANSSSIIYFTFIILLTFIGAYIMALLRGIRFIHI